MTDAEIIKVLEFCQNEKCASEKCPLYGKTGCTKDCLTMISGYALFLIKRQQTEITKQEKMISDRFSKKELDQFSELRKKKAVKEFAERIVEQLERASETYCKEYGYAVDENVLYLPDAIEIVKGEQDE